MVLNGVQKLLLRGYYLLLFRLLNYYFFYLLSFVLRRNYFRAGLLEDLKLIL